MGEFVVVQVLHNGEWLDYSRCSAPEATQWVTARGERGRAKHWITGRLLNAAQLECMAAYPDGFNDREPREWWRVTMTWEGESRPSESVCSPYIYKLGEAIMELHKRGLEASRGDVMEMHIVSEEA